MALKNIHSDEDIPMEVIGLYLDFISLFPDILELIIQVLLEWN